MSPKSPPRAGIYLRISQDRDDTRLGVDRHRKDERPQGQSSTEEEKTSKRRAMRDAIVRDNKGKPVPPNGWEAIVSEDLWWSVQALLDDPGRATNRVGTERRHLGLYRCGLCEQPVRRHSRGYHCKNGHVRRKHELIDEYVLGKVRQRLGADDLKDVIAPTKDPRVQAITAQVDAQRADIERARDDYTARRIGGVLYQRISETAEAEIRRLEAERLKLATGTAAAPVMGSPDPVEVFDGADLATRRAVIDKLVTVYLYAHPQGKNGLGEGTVEVILNE